MQNILILNKLLMLSLHGNMYKVKKTIVQITA